MDFLASLGVDMDSIDTSGINLDAVGRVGIDREQKQERVLEADGVLTSLKYPLSKMMRKCTYCGELFQTNYRSTGCCSILCRKRYLEKEFGIPWNPTGKPVWGEYEPPTVISAASLKQLYEWAKKLVEDYDRLADLADQPVENPQKVQKVHSPQVEYLLNPKSPGFHAETQERTGRQVTLAAALQDSPTPQSQPEPVDSGEHGEEVSLLDDILANL